MSEFKIGDNVLLNGKTYKIVGTVKRSFKLERNGKFYKATSNMMGKIQDQNAHGIGVGRKTRTSWLQKRLERDRIFNPNARLPETTEEILDYFDRLTGELSPENLSCDGELSRTAINQKLRNIRGTWKELERMIGRKVSESEIEDRWFAKHR